MESFTLGLEFLPRTPIQEGQEARGKGLQEGHGASPEQADIQNKGQRQVGWQKETLLRLNTS